MRQANRFRREWLRWLVGLCLGAALALPGHSQEAEPGPPVVVVHGVGAAALAQSPGDPFGAWPFDVTRSPTTHTPNLEFTAEGDPRPDTNSIRLVPWSILPTQHINGLIESLRQRSFTVRPFVYDWRYSVPRNAALLHAFIEQVRQETGAGEVDVVAHSMGGLVARQVLLDHPDDAGVGTLVLVAAPNLGAPRALKALRYGDVPVPGMLSIAFDRCKLKRASHNMPGVFDLLPGRRYFQVVGGYYDERFDIDGNGRADGLLNFDQMVANLKNGREHVCRLNPRLDAPPLDRLSSPLVDREVVAFHDALDAAAKPANVRVFQIAGYGVSTLVQIIERSGKPGERFSRMGDGAVPLGSAETVSVDAIYYAELAALRADHESQLANREIQAQVRGLLLSGAGVYGRHISIVRPALATSELGGGNRLRRRQ